MEIKKLKTVGLEEAMLGMEIGQTCETPDDCSVNYVRSTCSILNRKGYLFVSNGKTGVMMVTRLK